MSIASVTISPLDCDSVKVECDNDNWLTIRDGYAVIANFNLNSLSPDTMRAIIRAFGNALEANCGDKVLVASADSVESLYAKPLMGE